MATKHHEYFSFERHYCFECSTGKELGIPRRVMLKSNDGKRWMRGLEGTREGRLRGRKLDDLIIWENTL